MCKERGVGNVQGPKFHLSRLLRHTGFSSVCHHLTFLVVELMLYQTTDDIGAKAG